MPSSLPIFAAFQSKSSGKYLRYNVDDGAGPSRQLLQLNGDDAVNPYTRFYMEPSYKHGGFFHVQCRYNNKYWVAEQHPNDDEWWIAGSAHEPEEDLSLPSCTLFQLKPVGEDKNTIRLMHGHLGTYAGIRSAGSSADGANGAFVLACLHVPSAAHLTLVELPLWTGVLPKHVCFKDHHHLYLVPQAVDTIHRLIFSTKDIKDPAARHTIVTYGDGRTAVIKSEALGLFWRRNPATPGDPWDRIVVDSGSVDADDDDRNRLFRPFLLNDYAVNYCESEAKVALLSLGNNLYCERHAVDDDDDTFGLTAKAKDNMRWTVRIGLYEPVVSREITVVQFSLTHARLYRLYGEEELTLATATAYNDSSSPATMKLTFEITLKENQVWSSSVTLRTSVMTTISSQVPSMVDDGGAVVVTGLSSFNGMYSWGTPRVKTSRETVVQFVALPPMTEVTATCRAKRSSFDVPFSYRQADKLIDGEELNLEFEDGIYSGQNFHSLVYDYQHCCKLVT